MDKEKKKSILVWVILDSALVIASVILGIFLYRNPSKGPGELEVAEENFRLNIAIEEKYQHKSQLVRNQYEIREGILYGTGENESGQLGIGHLDDLEVNYIEPIPIAEDVIHVASCQSTVVFLTKEKELWGMGKNESGQLGVPLEQSRVSGKIGYVASPVLIAEGVKYASVGLNTVMYLTEEGQVYVLGDNRNGQLGPARGEMDIFDEEISMKTKASHEPVLVMDHVVFISSGLYTLAAITDEGKLYMWGDNSFGEIGNGNRGEGLPTQCKYFVIEPYLVKEHIKDVWFEEFTVYAVNYWDEVYAWGKYKTTPQKIAQNKEAEEAATDPEGTQEAYGRKTRPTKEEVLVKRELVFADMSDEERNRMTTVIARANLELEHEYLYGNFFSNLSDPENLTWNLFHQTGKVQTGWGIDGEVYAKYGEGYFGDMTEDQLYELYGTPVITYNSYTADDFIRIMEELGDSTGSAILKADFNTLIREMELAKEDHQVEHIFNIYYLLHDLDYFLLRYGPEDVGKYTWDDSTVTAYYGVLKVYEAD